MTERNLRQFGLLDLFALMTLVAMLLAMFMPLLRELKPRERLVFTGIFVVQLALALGMVAYAFFMRGRLLAKAGRRWGVGYRGDIRWQHWPIVKSGLLMLGVASIQLGLAIAFSQASLDTILLHTHPLFLLGYLQMSYATGRMFASFTWRVYPNAIEFFENGVARGGLYFPWEQVNVRASQFFADRIVVVMRGGRNTRVGDTSTVLVANELREQIFRSANLAATNGSDCLKP